jgi:hypothetical protein
MAFDNDHLEVSMIWNNSPQRCVVKDNMLARMLQERSK